MLEDLRKDEQMETAEDSAWLEYESCWTCPSAASRGDTMLIYLMRPISAIIASATFSSEPFTNNDLDSEWFGKRMATYIGIKVFDESEFVSLFRLRELFPEWYWTTRPQGAVKVPEIYEQQFLDLLRLN